MLMTKEEADKVWLFMLVLRYLRVAILPLFSVSRCPSPRNLSPGLNPFYFNAILQPSIQLFPGDRNGRLDVSKPSHYPSYEAGRTRALSDGIKRGRSRVADPLLQWDITSDRYQKSVSYPSDTTFLSHQAPI